MARGWESKSVESQMDSAAERSVRKENPKTAEQIDRERKRESLQLTRVRVVHDLESAQHERHKDQLRAALAHLDAEIQRLS